MKYKIPALLALMAAVCLFGVTPAQAVTTFTVTNVGTDATNLEVRVTITEMAGALSSVNVKLEVVNPPYYADLRGAFFHLSNESLLSGLVITGPDITDQKIGNDDVSTVNNDNGINGQVLNTFGGFDVGVTIGTQGIGSDDIASTTFNIAHDTQNITESMFTSLPFAVRATSVGTSANSRGDSSKLGGYVPEPDIEIDGGPSPIPEPASAAMGIMGLAGLVLSTGRRRRR